MVKFVNEYLSKANTIRLIQRFMPDENRLECHEKNGSKILE